MNILEAKHILRSVGFNLKKNLNEELAGYSEDEVADFIEDEYNTPVRNYAEEDALEELDGPTDADNFIEIENALEDLGATPEEIAELMSDYAEEIADYYEEGLTPEVIASKIYDAKNTEEVPVEPAIIDDELEEAKRIVTANGCKFVKESKRYAGKHPVFSGKEFQEYLLKECGDNCCDDDCCPKCKKSKKKCKCKK